MSKEHPQVKQINMRASLWNFLAEVGRELGYRDPRGTHSRVIREMVSAGVTHWRESPYVCHSARHVILVTGDGHVFYRLVQTLKLNSDRQRLPCALDLKPEKRRDFLLRYDKDASGEEAQWFKSRWLLNYFAAWNMDGQPLSSWVDRDGTDSKIADLEINQVNEALLNREIVVGIQDFVQWREQTRGYDRVDLPIDIPTQNLEVVVIVDSEIYRATPIALDDIRDLEVEFRNREGARFEGKMNSDDPENSLEIFPGRYPGKKRFQKSEEMPTYLQELEGRIQFLAQAQAQNGDILDEQGKQAVRAKFKLPKNFFFCKIEWPLPCFGLEVCVRWEKPTPLGGIEEAQSL